MTTINETRVLRFDGTSIKIGRDPENDEVIDEPQVSRFHAEISADGGVVRLRDLGSHNGTFVDGERVNQTVLRAGSSIRVGSRTFLFEEKPSATQVDRPAEASGEIATGTRFTIGRDPDNDLVLEKPTVSRFHAEILQHEDSATLRDLGSRNGTRVDGRRVKQATLEAGTEIRIGPYLLVFDGRRVVSRDEQRAFQLRADGIAVNVKNKQILAPVSLSVQPGELVVIIGESGSGKSTLLKALAGVSPPTQGAVTVNGEPITSLQSEIGYLPQDEIVHERLTVLEALNYAAQLRLPEDTTSEEIKSSVTEVLEEVLLEEHSDTRIGLLSGGQRKRAGLAPELLNQPSLLFLDEPTTGLDPGLETRTMELLRELAQGGRAVIVVTHATKNLSLCDRLIVMGRGGELCFEGRPDDALGFFEVSSYDGIYSVLFDRKAVDLRREFEARRGSAAASAPDEPAAAQPRRPKRARAGTLHQASVLARRYARIFVRDRRNVLILVGQAIPIAIAIALLYKSDIFDRPGGQPRGAAQFLFLTVTTAVWLGSISAAREIVKEWGVVDRETAVGVKISSYLISKAAILFTLAAVQIVLLAVIVFSVRPLKVGAGDYALAFGLLLLTSFVAVAMGLLISSVVRSQDQATSFIPIALIPQLLFGGAIVPVHGMSDPMKATSALIFSRWSFAGSGNAIDMNGRIGEVSPFARAREFGDSFFALHSVLAACVLIGFLLAAFGATAFILSRRTRPLAR